MAKDTKKKLYVAPDDPASARAQRYVWMVASVICLCAGAALVVLSIDLIRGGHVPGGILAAVPALAAVICGFASLSTMNKYKRAQLKLERKEHDGEA